MGDHKEYLATHVLNESQTVNYRMLSRALKIHSNRAKQCMYDFYSQQTKRRPDSISATYLLIGKRSAPTETNGFHSQASQDTPMASSPPFPSSSMPSASQTSPTTRSTRVILLAKEADLESAKASLTELATMHIYSLSPAPPSDLHTLGECTRRVQTDYAAEDPLQAWAQYGVVQNERVWRRTRNGRPVPPPAPAPVAKSAPLSQAVKSAPSSQGESKPAPVKAEPAQSTPAAKPPPQVKRQGSGIMASFARAPPAKKKEEEAAALSDDEKDDAMDLGADAEPSGEAGKTKREREAELRAMMDMSDYEEEEKAETKEEEEEEDAVMLDAPPPDKAEVKEEEEEEEEPTPAATQQSSDGRRRGRRRVMKKRTVKDEEGYLVTREEAVWESFSEDEAPKKTETKPAAPAPAKKAAAATGPKKQGGIMSFFAKK